MYNCNRLLETEVQLQLLVFYDFILAVRLHWMTLQTLLSWEVRSCLWYLPAGSALRCQHPPVAGLQLQLCPGSVRHHLETTLPDVSG